MKTFEEALKAGFKRTDNRTGFIVSKDGIEAEFNEGYWTFTFGNNNEYELCFEPLIFDQQYYVAVYKNKELLTEKVVIKPGYTKHD